MNWDRVLVEGNRGAIRVRFRHLRSSGEVVILRTMEMGGCYYGHLMHWRETMKGQRLESQVLLASYKQTTSLQLEQREN